MSAGAAQYADDSHSSQTSDVVQDNHSWVHTSAGSAQQTEDSHPGRTSDAAQDGPLDHISAVGIAEDGHSCQTSADTNEDNLLGANARKDHKSNRCSSSLRS